MTTELLPTAISATPRKPGVPTLGAIAIGTSALLIAGAGTVLASGSYLGGGQQPEQVLPASAVAMAKIDLNPPLGQKVAIYELSRQLHAVHAKSAGSVRDDLLSSLFSSGTDPVDYVHDIKPWLGDRAAVAAVPDGSAHGFAPVAAIQYTDKARAEKLLSKQSDATPPSFGFAFSGSYVIIAKTQADAARYAQSSKRLADRSAYSDAVRSLPGDQIVLGWADVKGLYDALPKADLKKSPFGSPDRTPAGSLIVGGHVDSHYLEIVGKAVNVGDSLRQYGAASFGSERGHNLLASFPSDTAAALEVTGLGKALTQAYGSIAKDRTIFGPIEKSAQAYGIDLPGDINTLFGTDVAIGASGDVNGPTVVAHVKTADSSRAVTVLGGVNSPQNGARVEVRDDGAGGYYLGTDRAAIAAATSGTLGATALFRRAVPDAKTAGFALFVDLTRMAKLSSSVPTDFGGLQAVGMTADATLGQFRIRLTVG